MCLNLQVTKSITSIVSNIAQVETEELEAAEEESGAISKFIQAFEEQISRVKVADGGMLNIQQPNVAVQVILHLYHRLRQNYLISTSILKYRISLPSYIIICMDITNKKIKKPDTAIHPLWSHSIWCPARRDTFTICLYAVV